jgi:histidyl-tRNA synthetase
VAEAAHDGVFAVVDKIERVPREVSVTNLTKLGLDAAQLDTVFKIAQPGAQEFDARALAASNAELEKRLTTFQEFRRHLDAFGLRDFVRQDFSIVRGLAYYTGIVFEAHDRQGKFRAIAGGGRYDNLLKLVSGGSVNLPALGFGMGDVVLTELLRERGKLKDVPDFTVRFEGLEHKVDGYVVVVDESLRGAALKLIHDLRDSGFSIDYSLAAAKVGKQFEQAASLKARWAIVLGPQEWQSGQVKLKNMASGQEEAVTAGEVAARLK